MSAFLVARALALGPISIGYCSNNHLKDEISHKSRMKPLVLIVDASSETPFCTDVCLSFYFKYLWQIPVYFFSLYQMYTSKSKNKLLPEGKSLFHRA